MTRTRRDGLSGREWRIAAPEDAPTIADLDAPAFVGRLLRRRGIENAAQAEAFLDPDRHVPAAPLAGMSAAVERILRARRDREAVAVYGDYDVDGVTSTTILHEALDALGIDSRWFIPHRREDGYGLHGRQLKRLADAGASLVVTADCGITANDTIRSAEDQSGLEFVIVDHHTPDGALPDVAALLAPRTEDPLHPLAELSTGGLAYHLAHALMAAAGIDTPAERWLDLAALSTIADVVPLVGENRRLVHAGLRSLQPIERPGLKALVNFGARGQIDAEAVAFQIAPRINAAGRLESASLAVELLLSPNADQAVVLAHQLDALNTKRRVLSDAAYKRALSQVEARPSNGVQPLVVFAGDDETHPGVVGIVAGRLQDRFQRPSFAYTVEDGVAQASGRSPAPFDLAAMLASCDDLLIRHGGHARAAAFTAETRHLPALLERLCAHAEQALEATAAATPRPTLEIDGQVALHAVTPEHVRWIERLRPFGAANPPPLFLSEDVLVSSTRRMGAGKLHLRLNVGPRHPDWRCRDWPAVAWRQGHAAVSAGQGVDLVWSLRRDWRRQPELEIHDLALRRKNAPPEGELSRSD